MILTFVKDRIIWQDDAVFFLPHGHARLLVRKLTNPFIPKSHSNVRGNLRNMKPSAFAFTSLLLATLVSCDQVDPKRVSSRCAIVAYVMDATTQEVLQVEEVELD